MDICGRKIVQPPSVVMSDGAKQWSNVLIGNFLGKSPPLVVFHKTADKLVCDWVLEADSWHIQQKAIVLRKWKPGLLLDEVCVEVGAKDEIPDSILVDLGNENVMSIAIEPIWSPRYKHCAIFGHSEDKCLKGVSAVGVVILKEDESIGHVVQDKSGRDVRECVVQDCSAQGASS
ncbi:hypothetical protein V6N13_134630 [Hibiscus sabdariffa]